MNTAEALKVAREALEEVLNVGRGTSGRLILERGNEDDIRAALSALSASAEQQPIPDGWIFMRHPSRFNGDWVAARVWEEDGVKLYMPWEESGSDLEWDERSEEWEIYPSAPQASQPVEMDLADMNEMDAKHPGWDSQPVALPDDVSRMLTQMEAAADSRGYIGFRNRVQELRSILSATRQSIALTDEQIEKLADEHLNFSGGLDSAPHYYGGFNRVCKFARSILSATSQPSAWDQAIEALSRLRGKHRSESGHFESDTGAWIADCDEADAYDAALLDALEAIRALRQQAPAVQDDYCLGGPLMLVVRRPGMAPFLKRPYGDTAAYVREVFRHNPDAEITIVRSWADGVGCQTVEDAREFLAMEDALLGDDDPAPAPQDTGEASATQWSEDDFQAAPAVQEALPGGAKDALNTILWLYRRLPREYGRPPGIEMTVNALSRKTGVEVAEFLAERGEASHPAPAQTGEKKLCADKRCMQLAEPDSEWCCNCVPEQAQTAPVNVPSVDSMIGNSKAVLRLVDEYIDGVQTQQTRTKLRAGLMDLFAAAPSSPIAANSEDAGWISVKDRLPEQNIDVQVYCEDTEEQFVAFYANCGGFQYALDRIGERIVCHPTHWMPLPAAPAAIKNGEQA